MQSRIIRKKNERRKKKNNKDVLVVLQKKLKYLPCAREEVVAETTKIFLHPPLRTGL